MSKEYVGMMSGHSEISPDTYPTLSYINCASSFACLLRLLQLPDCICFSCCSPNCLSFSCCSLIASACDHTHAVQSIIYKGRTSCAGLVPPLDYPTSVAHRQTHTLKILMYGWLLDVTVSPCVCNSLSVVSPWVLSKCMHSHRLNLAANSWLVSPCVDVCACAEDRGRWEGWSQCRSLKYVWLWPMHCHIRSLMRFLTRLVGVFSADLVLL